MILAAIFVAGLFFLAPVVTQTIYVPCPNGQADAEISWYNSLGCTIFKIGITYSGTGFSSCMGDFVAAFTTC
jgi:hypothetical protein